MKTDKPATLNTRAKTLPVYCRQLQPTAMKTDKPASLNTRAKTLAVYCRQLQLTDRNRER